VISLGQASLVFLDFSLIELKRKNANKKGKVERFFAALCHGCGMFGDEAQVDLSPLPIYYQWQVFPPDPE
jgi:hypothetical protein